MSSPGSSYNVGADSVTANVSVNVPTDTVSTFHQLAKQAEQFRTEMEAIVRAEGDFLNLLEKMPEIAQKAGQAQENMINRINALSGKQGGSSGASSGLNQFHQEGPGFVDHTAGFTEGMPRKLEALQQNDPRAIINMRTERGMIDTTTVTAKFAPEDIQKLIEALGSGGGSPSGQPRQPQKKGHGPQGPEEGIHSVADLAQRLLGEMAPGGSIPGLAQVGREVMGGIEGQFGGMAGGFGGLAKVAGGAGAGIGVALAANQIVQMVGAEIQGYRNMGSIRGGNLQEGVGYEAQAQMLAMDPFISTEQARSVIQGALSQGYQGKQFDTVQQFVVENLKDLNVQAGDSFKMLRKGVDEAHGSISTLATTLTGLKESSQTGVKNFESMKKDFESTLGAATDAGAEGNDPMGAAAITTRMWKDNFALSGLPAQIMQAAYSNPQTMSLAQQAAIAHGNTDPKLKRALPGAVPGQLGADYPKEVMQALMDRAQGLDPDDPNSAIMFQSIFQSMIGQGITTEQAKAMLEEFHKNGNPVNAANADIDKEAGTVEHHGLVSRTLGTIGKDLMAPLSGAAKWMGNLKSNFTGMFGAVESGDLKSAANFGAHLALPTLYSSETTANALKQGMQGAETSPLLEAFLKNNGGAKNVQLVGPDNKVQDIAGAGGSSQQVEAFARGDLRAQIRGENKSYSAREMAGAGGGANIGGQHVSGTLTVELKGDAAKYLSTPSQIQLSPGQQKAMQGYGNNTMNNRAPGE